MKRPLTSPVSRRYFGLLPVVLFLTLVIGGSAIEAENQDDGSLAKGAWITKSQKISGSWKILQRGSDRFLVTDEDFKTRKAPDLKIVFSPLDIEKANNKNALAGSRTLASLPTVKGGFSIKLPADLDLDDFKSILIHCEKYAKLWGGANLR